MGGHSAVKQANEFDPEWVTMLHAQKAAVEEKAGTTFEHFEVVEGTQQVVAGSVFRIKFRVGHAQGEHIWAQIFIPLPHSGKPAEVQSVSWESIY